MCVCECVYKVFLQRHIAASLGNRGELKIEMPGSGQRSHNLTRHEVYKHTHTNKYRNT